MTAWGTAAGGARISLRPQKRGERRAYRRTLRVQDRRRFAHEVGVFSAKADSRAKTGADPCVRGPRLAPEAS
jgi:hypothetical protein